MIGFIREFFLCFNIGFFKVEVNIQGLDIIMFKFIFQQQYWKGQFDQFLEIWDIIYVLVLLGNWDLGDICYVGKENFSFSQIILKYVRDIVQLSGY